MLIQSIPSLRRLRLPLLAIFIFLLVLLFLLPYDNPVRLLFRYYGQTRLNNKLPGHRAFLEKATAKDGPYPVNFTIDMSVIVKTGYGTAGRRVQALLDALSDQGVDDQKMLVVGDYDSQSVRAGKGLRIRGKEVRVWDAVGWIREGREWVTTENRWRKYEEMKGSLQKEDNEKEANEIARKVGWELDGMKFLPSLALALKYLPKTPWVLLLDDDSLPLPQTITRILTYFSPLVPQYLGNPVGPFQARFAHGGSGVLFSRPALLKLFAPENRAVLEWGIKKSLREQAGDIVLSDTIKKVGIYLDETFEWFFTGEPPILAKVMKRNACLPLAGVHRLREENTIRDVWKTFESALNQNARQNPGKRPLVYWHQLLSLFHLSPASELQAYSDAGGRQAWDHVGSISPAEHTSEEIMHLPSANDCALRCRLRKSCLAWAWSKNEDRCKLSDWVMVGKGDGNWVSSVMVERVKEAVGRCKGGDLA